MTGSFTRARAMATLCCWPPESWSGRWFFQSDHLESLDGPAAPFGGGNLRIVQERQFHVLDGGGAAQEVVALENETDFLAADAGERVPFQLFGVLAVQYVVSCRRPVHAPEYVQHGGLPGTACPHDGHEFAFMYVKRYASERMDGLFAHFEVAAQVLDRKNRGHIYNKFLFA